MAVPPMHALAASGGAAWSPAELSGLTCWLRASDISGADADPIGTWSDLSGHGIDATQGTPSSKPTLKTAILNGKSVVRFDGTDDYMTTTGPMVGTVQQVHIIVCKMTTTQDSSPLANGNIAANGLAILTNFTGSKYQVVRGGYAIDDSGVASDNNWDVLVLVAGGVVPTVGYDLFVNGGTPILSVGTIDAGTPASSSTVGSYTSSLLRFSGDIAEIITCSSATLAELNSVLRYVTSQYAISTTAFAASASIGSIVYDGDSQMAGTNGGGTNVAAQTMALTTGTKHYERATGADGKTVVQLDSDAATRVDPAFIATRVSVVPIWAGTNDMFFGASGADAYANLATYCANRKAVGWKVIVFTALPRTDLAYPAGYETERQIFNTLVRANYATIADALVDIAADARVGDAGDELDTTYYHTDRVHLNNTGRAIVAGLLDSALAGLGLA